MLTRSKDQHVGKAFLRYLRYHLKYLRDHCEAIAVQHDLSTGESMHCCARHVGERTYFMRLVTLLMKILAALPCTSLHTRT